MNTELYNRSLGINETDIREETDMETLLAWKNGVRKDIISMSEKHDQNRNPLLLREDQDAKEAAIAAHKAMYARDRQVLLLDIIMDKIKLM